MNEDLYKSPMTPPAAPAGPSMPPSQFMTPPPAKKNSWLVIVLVLIILAAAGYYFYYNYYPDVNPSPDMGMMRSRTVLPDQTAAIEKDLQAMPLNDLDSEMKDIDKELGK